MVLARYAMPALRAPDRIRAAPDDLAQEHDVVPLLLHCDAVVLHPGDGALQLRQLVVMGGEQRLGP